MIMSGEMITICCKVIVLSEWVGFFENENILMPL